MLTLTGLGLAGSNAQAASVIQNGSFETGPMPDSKLFLTFTSGSTDIPGWEVLAGSIDYLDVYWQASDGVRSIDLAGEEPGGIAQTFATNPGHTYKVTFDLAGNPEGIDPLKVLEISAAGQSAEFAFDATASTLENMGWQTRTWQFLATTNSATLSFRSIAPPGSPFGPTLDNISVVSMPEPSAALLVGVGLSSLALRRRRS